MVHSSQALGEVAVAVAELEDHLFPSEEVEAEEPRLQVVMEEVEVLSWLKDRLLVAELVESKNLN